MSDPVGLRSVTAADLGAVLPLNNAAVPAVGQLDRRGLDALVELAQWFRVAEVDGAIGGFLIGLHGPGLAYDSPNYRAFCDRYPEGFLYVDRIVVDPAHRNQGLGQRLYEELVDRGRGLGAEILCAEVNVRPRNDGSLRFHRRFGFRPVGEHDTDAARVQLLAYDLTGSPPPLDRHRVVDLTAEADADLARRLEFVLDLDRLKTVQRMSVLADGSRRENTAEHSWHLTMMAMALAPLAAQTVDLDRVIRILAVHDIVEADAGDTYVYDTGGDAAARKAELEAEAADRIFGLLPPTEASELRSLWDEYEARDTPEARFAYACDRVQPFLLNAVTGGVRWTENGVTAARIREIMAPGREGAPRLADLVERVLEDAVAGGHLDAGEAP